MQRHRHQEFIQFLKNMAQSEITKALSSYFREFILQLFPPHDNELVQTIQQEEAINGRQEITGAIATDERISHHMV